MRRTRRVSRGAPSVKSCTIEEAMNNAERMEKDRRTDSLLRLKMVRQRTGLSPATIYRREAAGTFPSRVRIGERSVAWYKSDSDDFVAVGGKYRREDF